MRTRLNHSNCGIEHVAEDQRPVRRRVRAGACGSCIMNRSYVLPLYQAMNASMHVAVGDDQAGGQHDLGHVVEVAHR